MAVATVLMRVGEVDVLVEVVPLAGSEPTSRLDRAREHAGGAFERAKDTIVEMATSTVAVARELARRAAAPAEIEIQFGLKFSAQGNVIVAGGSGEATLAVRLLYTNPAGTSSADGPAVQPG